MKSISGDIWQDWLEASEMLIFDANPSVNNYLSKASANAGFTLLTKLRSSC